MNEWNTFGFGLVSGIVFVLFSGIANAHDERIRLKALEEGHKAGRSSLKQEILDGLPSEKPKLNASADSVEWAENDRFNSCLKQVREIVEKI